MVNVITQNPCNKISPVKTCYINTTSNILKWNAKRQRREKNVRSEIPVEVLFIINIIEIRREITLLHLFSLLRYFIIPISYLYDCGVRHSSKKEAFNVLRT